MLATEMSPKLKPGSTIVWGPRSPGAIDHLRVLLFRQYPPAAGTRRRWALLVAGA